MDQSPDVLADTVRAKRIAIDNDLELLRVRAQAVHPRRLVAQWSSQWSRTAVVPAVLGLIALVVWQRRRKAVASLRDLLVHELEGLVHAERQAVDVFTRMRGAAANPDLASLFSRFADVSRTHIARLDRVLRSVGARAGKGSSAALEAIEAEGVRLLKRERDASVRDAGLIATAQRIAHVEIANYGTARAFADTLGYTYAAQLLEQSLEEERSFDQQLTRLAERFVNPRSVR